MSIFLIKIIALLSMVCDHIKYAIPTTENWITIYLGRISFPLFAFITCQGYIHTKDLKKYLIRLGILGLISQIPFIFFRTLVGGNVIFNVIYTFILGIFAIVSCDKIRNKFLGFCLAILIIILGYLIKVDYSWFGVSMVLIFYLTRNNKVLMSISYILLVSCYYSIYMGYGKEMFVNIRLFKYFVCTLIPLLIIYLYNGEKGKNIKYFFYWFYPVHILILYLINYFFIA